MIKISIQQYMPKLYHSDHNSYPTCPTMFLLSFQQAKNKNNLSTIILWKQLQSTNNHFQVYKSVPPYKKVPFFMEILTPRAQIHPLDGGPIFKQFSTLIFIIQLLFSLWFGRIRMLSTSHNISKYSFDADTEDSEIKAPRPRPMESEQLPPEFKLEEQDLSEDLDLKLTLEEKEQMSLMRRGSIDMHYSIIGFINRKIKEKTRQRIMSEQISHYQL